MALAAIFLLFQPPVSVFLRPALQKYFDYGFLLCLKKNEQFRGNFLVALTFSHKVQYLQLPFA